MLNQGNKYFFIAIFLLLFSCNEPVPEKLDPFFVSTSLIGQHEYAKVYIQICDSVSHYIVNKLMSYEAEFTYSYRIDSLICFNNDTNRFISCRHLYVNIPEAIADDLQFILGEKINKHWYFFKSASIAIPREMVKDHDIHQPLSYQQLHEIALKEVYGGYLNEKGEINEAWFTSHFENAGWGDFNDQASTDWFLKGKRFKTKKEYFEFVHLEKVRNNWASRDTTKAIIQLQPSL